MPNPKRRHSKTRTAKRRTHDALKPVQSGVCPQCQEAKPPHQVCATLRLLPRTPGAAGRRGIGIQLPASGFQLGLELGFGSRQLVAGSWH